MASEFLKRKLRQYSIDLIATHGRTNKLPATIIGAEHGRRRKVDCSGSPPVPMANSLNQALIQIAPIGTKGIDNYVGCCCEVRSSNQILLAVEAPIRNIQFTNAIRPRTNQVINRCQNCQSVFG
ncbi:MAG: hypothetical protein JST23_08255 [Bacteroidetes bacterium]|nr:hypothetical protein [Bacteroidota bacterium]